MKLRITCLSTATSHLPFQVPTHSPWRFALKGCECVHHYFVLRSCVYR